MIKLTKGFTGFTSKIGPLVSFWDFAYGLVTMRNTAVSFYTFAALSYSILHIEWAIFIASFAPLGLIGFILNNLRERKKFIRPPNTYVRNVKLVQAIMNLTSDLIDGLYEQIDDFIYWRNTQKTMVMLNALLLTTVAIWIGLLVMPFLPMRHILAVGIWLPLLANSDFAISVCLSLQTMASETIASMRYKYTKW